MNQISANLKNIISSLIIFLAFSIPIFFLPITTEFFEFNKLFLLAAITGIGMLLWFANMFVDKRVVIVKSNIDSTIILFLITIALSTLFSLDKVSSIYGAQGRWFPSFFSYLVLVCFYFLTSSNINKPSQIKLALNLFLAASSINTLVSLLSYYKIKLGPATWLQVPSFTLTGSVTSTTVLAALAVTLSIAFIAYEKNINKIATYTTAAILNAYLILVVNSLPAWGVIIAALFIIGLSTNVKNLKQNYISYAVIVTTILFCAILVNIKYTQKYLINANYPKEISLNINESWKTATSSLRDFPILGAGPSTFQITANRYKLPASNLTDYWNISFDKPFNEVFNIIASYGLVGLFISTYFIISTIKYALNVKKVTKSEDNVEKILSIMVLVTLATMLFTFSTVVTTFTLFLMLGLLTASKVKLNEIEEVNEVALSISSSKVLEAISLVDVLENANQKRKKEIFQYIVIIPGVLLVSAFTLFGYKIYAAEYYMRQSFEALTSNNVVLAHQYQEKAIKSYPLRALYHNTYAQTNLLIANAIAGQKQVNDKQKQDIQALIAQAIKSSRIATESVNPLDVKGWVNRAEIYKSLSKVAENAPQWTVASYNTAIQLDPSNPKHRLDLGGVYFATGNYLAASNEYKNAINLKPDYANARYNLAIALAKLGDTNNALRELEITKKFVNNSAKDMELINKTIQDIKNTPVVAGAKTSQAPTIEQLETEAEKPNTANTKQEPLKKADETKTLETDVKVDLQKTE